MAIVSGEYTDHRGPSRHSPSGWLELAELSKQNAGNLGVINSAFATRSHALQPVTSTFCLQ